MNKISPKTGHITYLKRISHRHIYHLPPKELINVETLFHSNLAIILILIIWKKFLNLLHIAQQIQRNKFTKLKISLLKTNIGQKAISFVGPSLWNSLPELTKKTENFNTFKHNVQKHCVNWINNKLMK